MQIPRSLYNVKLTFCPVDTLPVKDTFATSGWWQSKLPVSCPPCTTLRSPSGAPASAKISANMTAVTGVTGDGLNTMVLPDSWNAREKKNRIDMGYVCNISPRGCTIQNSLNYVFLSDFHKRVNSTIDVKRRLWEETSTHRKLGKIWGLKKNAIVTIPSLSEQRQSSFGWNCYFELIFTLLRDKVNQNVACFERQGVSNKGFMGWALLERIACPTFAVPLDCIIQLQCHLLVKYIFGAECFGKKKNRIPQASAGADFQAAIWKG